MSLESELPRLVDALRREKDINPEVVLQGIEAALLSAARKHFGDDEGLSVTIDRSTYKLTICHAGSEISPETLGRIAAQTGKQVIIQKMREAERDSIAEEFNARVGSVVNGSVYRLEGPNVVVSLGRTEGFLPRSEQMPNEEFRQGDRVRALVSEVKPVGTRVRVVLSRNQPDLVRRLFELEVPEVSEGIVEVRAIAREAGYRTKIAVHSNDSKVDPVGACVGVQGARIKNIVDELNGERIDVIRWSADAESFIAQTLKPAEIGEIRLDAARRRAQVLVQEDQLSLAIGKRGQNVRLACKLTGWEIDITTRAELEGEKEPVAAPAEAAVEPKQGVRPGEANESVAEPEWTCDSASVAEKDEPGSPDAEGVAEVEEESDKGAE